MQELKFSTAPTLLVVIDAKNYTLRKPNIGQVKRMEQAGASYEAVLACLEECGLPKAAAETLSLDDMNELMENLVPASKKKQ